MSEYDGRSRDSEDSEKVKLLSGLWSKRRILEFKILEAEQCCREGNGTPLQYSCLENRMEEPGGLQSMGSLRVGHN